MKTKFTIIALICCLFYLPFVAKAQWCGTDTRDGNYQWKVETLAPNQIKFTFHPIGAATGCDWVELVMHGGYGGYVMNLNTTTGDLEHTYTFPDAVPAGISFYFNYRIGAGGPHRNSVNENYTIGNNCAGPTTTPPTVSITSPLTSDPFTSPATVNITANATATEAGATISKVEFYSGTTKIGESTTAPYTFSWSNVQPGTYNLTAKAIDNNNTFATSAVVSITVGGVSTETWCGTSTNGEYQWKVESSGANITYTFHPLGVAVGGNLVLLNTRLGTSGGWQGYPALTKQPSGDFTVTWPKGAFGYNDNEVINLYFVYNGNFPGENNSSANPEVYTIGTNCATPLPVTLIGFNSKLNSNGTVNLTWATSSEQNNSYFLIERSADGKNFTTLQKVTSKGSNSQTRLDYQYNDLKPLAGNNYYRLTQFDLNGDSKVVGHSNQNVSLIAQSVTLSPNPLSGNELTINIPDNKATSTKVSISNIQGAIIFNQTVNANNGVVKINLNSKPTAGIYLVKIAESSVQKLIIK